MWLGLSVGQVASLCGQGLSAGPMVSLCDQAYLQGQWLACVVRLIRRVKGWPMWLGLSLGPMVSLCGQAYLKGQWMVYVVRPICRAIGQVFVVRPICRTNAAPKLWNSLPITLREHNSKEIKKKNQQQKQQQQQQNMKTHLFSENQICSHCAPVTFVFFFFCFLIMFFESAISLCIQAYLQSQWLGLCGQVYLQYQWVAYVGRPIRGANDQPAYVSLAQVGKAGRSRQVPTILILSPAVPTVAFVTVYDLLFLLHLHNLDYRHEKRQLADRKAGRQAGRQAAKQLGTQERQAQIGRQTDRTDRYVS